MKTKINIITVFALLLFSCNTNKKMQNIKIEPLSPYHYEFKDSENNLDKIDYFFLKGDFQVNDNLKKELHDFITNYSKTNTKKYAYNSVYIYKETKELNNAYKGDKSSFDGLNNEIIAYVRFNNNELDIFYILEEGNVVFDLIKNQETNFEFEQ